MKDLTRGELVEALLFISVSAKKLATQVTMLPKRRDEEVEKKKQFKQCMRCTTKKSIVDDMYEIHGMRICEDCMFNLCEEDYGVKVQKMELYFDNEGNLIGNSLCLDIRDVIRLTLKKHNIEYKLIEPTQQELRY